MAAFDTTRTAHRVGLIGRVGHMFTTLRGAYASWVDARTTRDALSRLSDQELADIGLLRGDIDSIANGR
ncbi:DUF1127 domain-containing protein [Chachezhania sediminis]|uniref:DUF1127 domain-containing protein n=1 Tax=Chachezhania sediminis TaxID=2599291 RepID=UPI00131AD640|nr:DUF1127 domain-containing protein [Chachezhania sediminis]